MILEEYNRQTKKLNVLGQYNKQEFSNRAFCILAHCDTENKLKQLNDKIDIVKQKYNLEIYLFSHLFVPEHIVNKVDYFLFNKNNPIHNIDLFTDVYNAVTFFINFNDKNVRRAMFYHGYAHYLQMYDAISLLNAQNVDFGYIMNYDIPNEIIDSIEEYQKMLLMYDLVHYNYDEGDSMSTEVYFCKINSVFEKLKNSLSLTNYEKNGVKHTGSLEGIFKTLLAGLKSFNLGNYKDTQGKAYIGNHNFDFYSKNKISILHSNINDLIIIPHAYESDNRFISFCNSVSPVSKTKNVKLIFKNYQEEVLKDEIFDINPTERKHISYSSKFELLTFNIDDKNHFTIDLNDKNNYGYYSAT